jgi:hypothetical protein
LIPAFAGSVVGLIDVIAGLESHSRRLENHRHCYTNTAKDKELCHGYGRTKGREILGEMRGNSVDAIYMDNALCGVLSNKSKSAEAKSRQLQFQIILDYIKTI